MLLCLLLPLIIVRFFSTREYKNELYENRANDIMLQTEMLKSYVTTMTVSVESATYSTTSTYSYDETAFYDVAVIYDARIAIINSYYVVDYDSYNLYEKTTNLNEAVVSAMNGTDVLNINMDDEYIETATGITNSKDEIVCVIYGMYSCCDITSLCDSLEWHLNIICTIVSIIFIIIIFIYIFIVQIPVLKLKNQMIRIRNGKSDSHIKMPRASFSELSDLAALYNDYVDKTTRLDNNRQQFVSDVSHELKTPIAAIRVLSDSLLSMEDVSKDMYKEFLTDISGEVNRESKIIDDLLTLSRLDSKTENVNILEIKKCNVNEIVSYVAKRLDPIARAKNVDITIKESKVVIAEIDEVLITMAIGNIVENAVKYNKPGGFVTLLVTSDTRDVTISITDTGIGIPKEDLNNVFDRFYRVDKTRSRETGGTGLGLSISKNIVNMHDGDIFVNSETGIGTVFKIIIPLRYISDVTKEGNDEK